MGRGLVCVQVAVEVAAVQSFGESGLQSRNASAAADELDRGDVALVPWDEVRRRLRAHVE